MIEEHRGEFEYDWRFRFQLPLSSVGTRRMSYGEAWRLTMILVGDMSSRVAAAVAGWDGPIDRIDATLRDLFDLQHQSKASKKVKAYPRPWPDKVKTLTKPGAGVTQEQIVSALRFAGHTALAPGELMTSVRPRDARGRFAKSG